MNSSIHTTPVNGLSTPPSHERMGEPARRSLFLNSPGMLEAMRPYARRLNFSETNSSLATNGSPRFMTSTPAQNGTVTLGSSPWQTSLNITGLNNLLPPMEGPQPQEVIQQALSFTRESEVSNQDLPREVQNILDQNQTMGYTVVVTTTKTYTLIPNK